MTVHAFADESRRGSTYLIAVAIAMPVNLRDLRRDLRGLLLPRQRELHFKREKEPRQRQLAAAISRFPVEVLVYQRSCGRKDEPARQVCLERLILDLLDRGAHRLVLDSRSNRDPHDEATIHRLIGRRPHATPLVYEHLNSTCEPVLWIAVAVAWCVNAGGRWRQRVDPILSGVIDLDCP